MLSWSRVYPQKLHIVVVVAIVVIVVDHLRPPSRYVARKELPHSFEAPRLMSLRYQSINLCRRSIVRSPITWVHIDIATPMGTALAVRSVRSHMRETQPAEVVAAVMARHVVASALLLDVDAAIWTPLCAHGFDPVHGLLIFLFGGFAADGAGVPGAVTGEAERIIAVWTGDFLGRIFGRITAAVFDREVLAALRGETGDEARIRGEVMLGQSGVVSAGDQFLRLEGDRIDSFTARNGSCR
jgi:hypothetical protein